jgi:nitrite reductase/ring-hydroxylating ferredoxin subunit
MSWIETIKTEELEQKGRVIVRDGARQIALLKTKDRIFAVDNRCPHEGYPLKEGTVDPNNCVLTCNWHNWKFDLTTGKNIVGEDDVTVYETKQEGGKVWIKIPEIDKEKLREQILGHLRTAFVRQQYGRLARELARLHFNDIDPITALKKAIEWSYDKLEYGMDHAYAVAADWLTLYDEFDDAEKRIACLTEAIDYMAYESLRQPIFAFTEAREPFSYDAFLAAVEQQDENKAVALLNGALDAGLHFHDLEKAFTEAALKHYNDFGHSLIYLSKVGRLIERLGVDVEKYLLRALIRSICYATREDLLPDFRRLPSYLEKLSSTGSMETSPSKIPKAEELFFQPIEYAMEWVLEKSKESPPEPIYWALLKANAKHLLHYDMSYQFSYRNPVSKNVGWLDFTHGITFANAVRHQCRKFPEFWKYGLLQLACFSGRNHSFVDRGLDEAAWLVKDRDRFFSETLERFLDHGKSQPIFAAHYVKTSLAVRQEVAWADEGCAKYLLAALNRFLNSPLKEKHVRRTVQQAMDLVGRNFV